MNTNTPTQKIAASLVSQTLSRGAGIPAASRTQSVNTPEVGKPGTNATEKDKLLYVAREFSGFFISQFLKGMRNTVKTSEFGRGGTAEKQFQALADDEYAKAIGKSDFYGLTSLIYESLARKNEKNIRQPAAMAQARIADARRLAAKDTASTMTTGSFLDTGEVTSGGK